MINLKQGLWLIGVIYCTAAIANSAPEAMELRQDYRSMQETLMHSPLQRPVHIRSEETSGHLSGDLFASMDFSLATLALASGSAERWCEIVLLLSNTKACRIVGGANNSLVVSVSSSKSVDAAGATETTFQWDTRSSDNEYFEAGISAKDGPMGTQDISLRLQAVALTPSRTFLRLHYAYNTQWLGRVAMQAYLATLGRGKVGFTPATNAETNTSGYIEGVRAVIERNTMRYFLGLDCASTFAQQDAPQRFHSIADCWFGQIEQYPLQLHEMQRAEYLQMKNIQYQR